MTLDQGDESDRLAEVVAEVVNCASDRCKELEGRDLLALQTELLEWLSDWQNLEVLYCDDFSVDN